MIVMKQFFTLFAAFFTASLAKDFVPANPNAVTIFGCDFDSDFCNIAVQHDTKFGWFRTKEIMSRSVDEREKMSRYIHNAHTRVDFLRTRARRKSTMTTDMINVASGRVCIAFDYCIRGSNVQFNVSVSQNGIENQLYWSKSGSAIDVTCDTDFFNVNGVYMFKVGCVFFIDFFYLSLTFSRFCLNHFNWVSEEASLFWIIFVSKTTSATVNLIFQVVNFS